MRIAEKLNIQDVSIFLGLKKVLEPDLLTADNYCIIGLH